jgi:hypothetical protein
MMRHLRLGVVLAPAIASAQPIKPYILIDFDTSGSALDDVCTQTDVDQSAECAGSDVACATCNAGGCGNGVADDSALWKAKTGTANMIGGATQDVTFALARMHQTPTTFACKGGGWLGAASLCGGSDLGMGDNSGDILVEFADGNRPDMLDWMDFCDNWPTSADCSSVSNLGGTGCSGLCPDCGNGCDKELRASGGSPVAGSLYSARDYIQNTVMPLDPDASCRPYSVIEIANGPDNCIGDAPTEAAALCDIGVAVHVAELGVCPLGCADPCFDDCPGGTCPTAATVPPDGCSNDTGQAAACITDCSAGCEEFCEDNEIALAGCGPNCDRASSGDPVCTGTPVFVTNEADLQAGLAAIVQSADACGDACCTGSENACNCATDCPAACGDGCCTGGETTGTCPSDCVCVRDGICDTLAGENACGCPADCGPSCGDGCCTGAEDSCACPADCPGGCCGDLVCGASEDACGCPGDCAGDCCGDLFCGATETACNCPSDCVGDCCGDLFCGASETACTCPSDCLGDCCGDSTCGPSENPCTCPGDCAGDCCGDLVCGPSETACACASDCPDACGDGCCTGAEDGCACPSDCGGDCCGDFICGVTETACTCPIDCVGDCCGDSVCGATESKCTCPGDCPDVCGDGCCTGSEECAGCPTDCGACPDAGSEPVADLGPEATADLGPGPTPDGGGTPAADARDAAEDSGMAEAAARAGCACAVGGRPGSIAAACLSIASVLGAAGARRRRHAARR